MDYRIVYVGAQTVYGILFLVLYFLNHLNIRNRKHDKLDIIYILFLATIILDSIWMMIDGKPEFRTWHILLEIVYLTCMCFTGYTWFLHTLDLFPAKSMKLRKYRFVLMIPVLIDIILVFASVKTGWVFSLDENATYHRGVLSMLPVLTNYVFMLLGSFVAYRCSREALLTIDKRRFLVAAFFPVPIIILSAAQVFLPPGLPTMQGGVLIAMLMLYGTSQNNLITTDYLTELPNRIAFEHDLIDQLHKNQGENTHLYLIAGDLDRFKEINDTYGHPTGDKALIHTAESLKYVFSEHSGSVFRTGGDEFMVILRSKDVIDQNALREKLNKKLSEEGELSYLSLSMSLGFAEYDGKTDFTSFIENADRKLYEEKARNHSL